MRRDAPICSQVLTGGPCGAGSPADAALRETAYLRLGEVFPASTAENNSTDDAAAADRDPGVWPEQTGLCDGHGCSPPSDPPPPATTPPSGKQALGEAGSGPGTASTAQCTPAHHTDATCRWPEQHVSPDTAMQADAASSGVCPGSGSEAGTCGSSTAAKPPGSKLLDYIRRWSVKRCATTCANARVIFWLCMALVYDLQPYVEWSGWSATRANGAYRHGNRLPRMRLGVQETGLVGGAQGGSAAGQGGGAGLGVRAKHSGRQRDRLTWTSTTVTEALDPHP